MHIAQGDVMGKKVALFAKQKRPAWSRGAFSKSVLAFDQTVRSTIIFLMFAMASAGFRPFGHVLAQFMIVWQR